MSDTPTGHASMYVGIDVSNLTLAVDFLDQHGRSVRPRATYSNDPDGWTALRTAIVSAARLLYPGARVVCGMEATANMHKRLEQALRAETRRALEVHVLNPRSVKHFAKALLRDAKTDRLDSHLIALYLLRMQPRAQAPTSQLFEEFRGATRTRRRLVEERTHAKNRLHKLLRYHLPGSRTVLGRSLSKGLLMVLSQFQSPQAIMDCPVGQLAAIRYGTRHRVGTALAQKLHQLAVQAPQAALSRVSQLELRITARRIIELQQIFAEMDEAIAELLANLFPNQVLTTIPGLGEVSAAAILAEVIDIRRFPTKEQFIGYCGLYPIVWESGEAKRYYRMSFKGNRMLKMTLLVASAAARQYNPAIAIFYERLRRRGKSKKAAGGAIARKLAELVFTLLRREEPWSPEKAMRGIAKSEAMRSEGSDSENTGIPCLTGVTLAGDEHPRPFSRSRNPRTSIVSPEVAHEQP
jgi:transposase